MHFHFMICYCEIEMIEVRSKGRDMSAQILALRPPTELAGYLRLGHNGFRKLADLHAAGRLHYRRLVVNAAYFRDQWDLIRDLQADGCEIVLDPDFAEMASLGRFSGSSLQKLPWSKPGRPWTADDISSGGNFDVAKAIAETAVAADVSAVLAPTHFLDASDRSWEAIDLALCEALRRELDRCGGKDIAIDYQWITSAAGLKDAQIRRRMMNSLADLPIENLWVRVGGLGGKATGSGTRHHLRGLAALHEAGKPIIADMTGGFPGLALMALGASGGLSHGLSTKEHFDLNTWRKPPSTKMRLGARYYVEQLDRYFSEAQLRAIFALKGGKARAGCLDQTCCPHGAEDMIDSRDAHFLRKRSDQIADLSGVPDHRRGQHFVERHLDRAVEAARQIARCEIVDDKLAETVGGAKIRLTRLRDAIVQHLEETSGATHSRPARFRGDTSKVGAVLRR
jgi:hypothetical protein